jgi:hypothetical protein
MGSLQSKSISLDSLENDLTNFLRPIQPSAQYINKIRDRIHLIPKVELSNPLNDRRKLLLSLGGVLTAGLLLITLARALFFFFRHEKA